MPVCFICMGEKVLEMKSMTCCKKYYHRKCFEKWIDYNKYCKFNNIILCPCCRTNIRDNLFVPLELHNMPLYFYLQYEKEVNNNNVNDTEYVVSDSDDDDEGTDDSAYTDGEDDDNDNDI